MTAPAPATVRVARPTFVVAGQDQSDLAEGLLAMQTVETVDGIARCEALFGNWGSVNGAIGFRYFDRRLLDFGKAFTVELGRATVFDGRVMGLEAHFPDGQAPRLAVLAEDRFQDLRMTRRTRTFDNTSDADVIQQIAGDHGLQTDVSLSGPQHRVLAQVNQSDLAFLWDRARNADARLWVEGDTLHARPRADRPGETIELTYGRGLREFAVLADLAGQRTGVTVGGWDVAAKSDLQFEATETAIANELNGGTSGASILANSLGSRKEGFVRTVPFTSQEAQTNAEALFRARARRFVRGRGVAEADGRLRVGAFVDLAGLGPLFDGTYFLAEVRHLFDGKRGIRTEFVAERPGLGQAR
jgi:Bacteriophage probable baseplate hub protein